MNITLNSVNAVSGSIEQPVTKNPKKLEEAAKGFESLLISQMMKSARGTSGWLSDGDETGEDSSMSMAEEQFAQTMANNGGLGLAKMVIRTMSNAAENAAPALPKVGR